MAHLYASVLFSSNNGTRILLLLRPPLLPFLLPLPLGPATLLLGHWMPSDDISSARVQNSYIVPSFSFGILRIETVCTLHGACTQTTKKSLGAG